MMSTFAPIPNTPDTHADTNVDVIGNLEALLREDEDEERLHSGRSNALAANNAHFFVVSTPNETNNPTNRMSNANDMPVVSSMNMAAAPFQPTLRSPTALVAPSFGGPMNTMAGARCNMPMMGGMGGGGSNNVSVVVGNDGLFSAAPTFTPYAPVHLNLTTPPRTSTLRDAVRPGFITFDALKSYTHRHFAVIVNNLDPRTQSKHLMSIFFPLGAVDALAFQSPVGSDEMGHQFAGRKGGIVLFTSDEMATMAASKIDDFVPHGQTLPLHTTYFGRYEDYLASRDTFTMNRPSAAQNPTTAAAPTAAAVAYTPSVASPTPTGDASQLIAVFVEAVSTTPEECDRAVEALISRFNKDPSRRAGIVITVCTSIQAQQDTLPHAQLFLRGISKYCIQNGLMNPNTERPVKLACGTICGAMFALQVVRGNPYGMALRIATELLNGNSDSVKDPLSEGQTNSLEALLAMGASWHSRVDASEKADVEEQFEAIVRKLTDEGRYVPDPTDVNSAIVTPTDAQNGAEGFPAPLPANDSANTTISADATDYHTCDVNMSAVSEVRSTSSFQVSATPVRCGPTHTIQYGGIHHHNVSVESNTSSLGPRLTASALQTPEKMEKRTVLSMDTSVLSNASTTSGAHHLHAPSATSTTMGPHNPLLSNLHAHHHHVNGMLSTMGGVVPMVMPMGGVPVAVANISNNSVGMVGSVPQTPFGMGLLAAHEGSNLRQHLMASTVYMTKVPLSIPHTILRKLFACFGEFNKVRIYEERKGMQYHGGAMMGGRGGMGSQNSFANRGNFGFVEFVVPPSSKAMVDFFRNPTSAVQVRMGITKAEMEQLLTMRVSFARSCIHDHDVTDAIFDASELMPTDADSPGRKVRPCTFGVYE